MLEKRATRAIKTSWPQCFIDAQQINIISADLTSRNFMRGYSLPCPHGNVRTDDAATIQAHIKKRESGDEHN